MLLAASTACSHTHNFFVSEKKISHHFSDETRKMWKKSFARAPHSSSFASSPPSALQWFWEKTLVDCTAATWRGILCKFMEKCRVRRGEKGHDDELKSSSPLSSLFFSGSQFSSWWSLVQRETSRMAEKETFSGVYFTAWIIKEVIYSLKLKTERESEAKSLVLFHVPN